MERWNIDQLAEMAVAALGVARQASARVREVPDKRTIRYYTTIGLLDRPLEMRGRTAFYGRRHVLQIVAIKRLQAAGRSLIEIQQQLAGASESALVRIAELPADFWKSNSSRSSERNGPCVGETQPASPAASAMPLTESSNTSAVENAPPAKETPFPRAREPFWESSPEILASEPDRSPPPASEGECNSRPALAFNACPALHLPLAPGATLVLEGIDPRRLDRQTLAQLLPAMQRFNETLRELKLVNPGPDSDPSAEVGAASRAAPAPAPGPARLAGPTDDHFGKDHFGKPG